MNRTYVPVLGAFAVQGVSQASDTGADEAIRWQVTVTDAGRKVEEGNGQRGHGKKDVLIRTEGLRGGQVPLRPLGA